MYQTIKFVFFIDCLNVNHIHDNPGHYTCDCVDSSDPCFADAGCVVEERCPESDGKSTGTNLPNISSFLKKKGVSSTFCNPSLHFAVSSNTTATAATSHTTATAASQMTLATTTEATSLDTGGNCIVSFLSSLSISHKSKTL